MIAAARVGHASGPPRDRSGFIRMTNTGSSSGEQGRTWFEASVSSPAGEAASVMGAPAVRPAARISSHYSSNDFLVNSFRLSRQLHQPSPPPSDCTVWLLHCVLLPLASAALLSVSSDCTVAPYAKRFAMDGLPLAEHKSLRANVRCNRKTVPSQVSSPPPRKA